MKSEAISNFLSERIIAGDFPSAVYLVAENGEAVFQDSLGHAVVEPRKFKATVGTIYDLASLTKPLVTGLLIAKLIDSGRLQLSDPIGAYLSLLQGEKADITIRELLLHTSGLPAWLPFYLFVDRKDAIAAAIATTELNLDQQPVTYSDLNFLLLAFILEGFHGETIEKIALRDIFAPLGLADTMFKPPADRRDRIAASERGNEYERNTCIELGYLPPNSDPKDATDKGIPTPISDTRFFRDYQIWGEVHDGNAWFMGGIAGHAGLFSTVEETFRIALQFLPEHTKLLRPDTTELFRTNFTKGVNEARSIAFQLAETTDSTAGRMMSPRAFGHLGFTGTSVWIDPVMDRVFILLTNRTHAHALPFVNINAVRRRFHDLAIEALEKKR
jgi:CubicO group peptidase (beta-lactamase class C family)